DPLSAKGVRASMGAVFRVPIDAGADLPEEGTRLALVPGGETPSWSLERTRPVVLVVGAERYGLPPELVERCDEACSIPQAVAADSLNAAQPATLARYEGGRPRGVCMPPR